MFKLFCMFLFLLTVTEGTRTPKFEVLRNWIIDGVYAVTIIGDYAYFGSNDCVYVIKLSNKDSQYETRIKIGGVVNDLYVDSNYLYVADREIGLQIFDISDLKNPRKLGLYLAPASVQDIWISNKYVYLAAKSAGVRIIDISHKDSLKEIANLLAPYSAWAVMKVDDYVYVSDYRNGLFIYDSNLKLINKLPMDGVGLGLYSKESYLYYAIGDSGLQIYDISNPARPKILGRCPRSQSSNFIFSWSVQVIDNYAFVADMGGLQIVDVSNPKKPKQIGYYSVIDDGFATQLFISKINTQEFIVYLTLGAAGLRILKVTF